MPPPKRSQLFGLLLLAGLVAATAGVASGAKGFQAKVPCRGTDGGAEGLIGAIKKAGASGGGAIELARDCTYTLSKGRFSNGQGPAGLPIITAPIAIDGRGSSIVRAKDAPEFRFFQLQSQSASLAIRDLTLRNGSVGRVPGSNNGGAILLGSEGSLDVHDSTLAANTAVNGGAIATGGAEVTITGSVLRRNSATLVDGSGGGIYAVNSPLTLRSSVVTKNESSGGGGGISSQSVDGGRSRATIARTTISDNVSELENGGGGIFTFGPARLVIRRSTIEHNRFAGVGTAGGGGGIANSGSMTLTDSTVAGNVAGTPSAPGAQGGGILNAAGATGTISATTIAANRTAGRQESGGGIAAASELEVTATIVAQNGSGNCLGSIGDGGFNLENGRSCDFNKHSVRSRPGLAPLADYGGPTKTMALRRGSPAIKKVRRKNPACGGTSDQRGVPRPQRRRCDIGAFEVVATRTKWRVFGGEGDRTVRLKATVIPRVWKPRPPRGTVVFRDRGRVVGKRKLDGARPDTASIRLHLRGRRHHVTASYQGSKLFLPSRSRTGDLGRLD